jgi:DNA adenine methylase
LKITALAPWFGSKRTLAPRIVAELGPHRAYWEPFCGSMAVLLAKPPCSMETVNDLHGDMVNLARVVKHEKLGPALYRRLRRIIPAQALMEDARDRLANGEQLNGELSLGRAEAYFVNSWLSMNGTAGTYGSGEQPGINGPVRRGIARRFSSGGGAPAIRFAATVGSIPEWRRRLRKVFVLSSDGLELCEKIEDKDGTVIYADPPYLVKGEKYIHDFALADHERLAVALRRFKETRCLVSYYAHPELERLYPGWTLVDMSVRKYLVNSGKQNADTLVMAPEVLLINGPSLEGGLF